MNRMPRETARLAREVTGMPTTPNMRSTPARERALATRTLPSIVGGCELWEFGASVLVSAIVIVVKFLKQCDRRRESEVDGLVDAEPRSHIRFLPHTMTRYFFDSFKSLQTRGDRTWLVMGPSTHQPSSQQPPVYNIKKSDFRDVVQKLTGSSSHKRFSTPSPIYPPKPPSSRLQRIRLPPLAPISNRLPPLLNNAVPPQPPPPTQSQLAPLSPLPPFPAVHAAAESPISAYMRFLQSSFDSDPKRFPGLSPLAPLVSPRWNNLPQPPPQQQHVLPPPTSGSVAQSPFPMPISPLPFGCFPSPRSPYPLISPSTTGQLGFQPFPLSPTLPVPSPRWKDL